MNPQEVPALNTSDRTCTRGVGVLSGTTAAGRVTLPLARVEISARVADRVAQVTVLETFRNAFNEPLEAVYVFPLAGGSAVSEFELKVGARTIRGKVDERAKARENYQKALDQGRRAALLEEDRDNVFTVQVGNLPPGEEATVKIVYSERLPYFEDGSTELRLPLVVAPRYIPGEPIDGVQGDTASVPDGSRITPPRLVDGFDPKVGLKIEVELADGELDDLRCSQHAVRGIRRVSLVRQDELLNRDFILRWTLAQKTVRSTALSHGSYAMLSILAPKREGFLGVPRDVVFLVDRSGSMGGVKMASAARACSVLIDTLGPQDRFAIGAFDDATEWLEFQPADEGGVEQGHRFLREIFARGGTELNSALGQALGRTRGVQGRIPIVVLLTDGQVGNEHEIFKRIQSELGDARVFTIGIDTAVNDAFLKRLANLGGGTSAFVVPGEALEEALRSIAREIGRPLVSDLVLEDIDAGLDRATIAPSRIPDLFEGRAACAYFKFKKAGRVRVRGRLPDGKPFEETVVVKETSVPSVGHLWARARVADLEDAYRLNPTDALKKQIVDLSIEHSILSRFTAFIVVDETEIVNKDGSRRTIVQPVHSPDRWEKQDDTRVIAAAGAAPMAAPSAPAKSTTRFRRRGFLGLFQGGAPEAEEACAMEPEAEPISTGEREAVRRAIKALFVAIDKADAAAIEKARAELMKLLSTSALGPMLPELQRFLRSEVVQMIAALKASAPVAQSSTLEKVKQEAEAVLGTASRGFWERTV